MKALVLAAGLGTRLRPHTERLPKPLFPMAGEPLLKTMLARLQQAGVREIMVNTHHLHHQLEAFLASQKFAVPVRSRHEREILGTGGAIKNLADFWNREPFLVVNSDIVSDIDYGEVCAFHLGHHHPVTLVLVEAAGLNHVVVDAQDHVLGFHQDLPSDGKRAHRRLAFTGIQVLDPEVLHFIPAGQFYSSIDAYRRMLVSGRTIQAMIPRSHYWVDVGTPERFAQASMDTLAPMVFGRVWPGWRPQPLHRAKLKGDGSDRKWYRLAAGDKSLVLADHGITSTDAVSEADAFVRIGQHLRQKNLPVPAIYHYDRFSGIVLMEDLGDEDLQTTITRSQGQQSLKTLYLKVIEVWVRLALQGVEGFDSGWTWQTAAYDRELILEKECRYFVEAFLQLYWGLDLDYEDYREEFEQLAQCALAHGHQGLIHRDLQARNIMVQNGVVRLIDFQGARLGPVQYDLASLLIDPYARLSQTLQAQLLDEAAEHITAQYDIAPDAFRKGYRYLAVTRNLQILGAFGFLSRVKGKHYFEQYIPAALQALTCNLAHLAHEGLPRLTEMARRLTQSAGAQ